MSKQKCVYQIFIRAPAERVWEAITTPEFTQQYFHATRVQSDFEAGSPIHFEYIDGGTAVDGDILEADKPNRLVFTWRILYDDAVKDLPASRVAFELEEMGDVTRLRLVHDEMSYAADLVEGLREGWSEILSSLKSLLETGCALSVAQPSAA